MSYYPTSKHSPGEEVEGRFPTPYPHPLLTPTPSKNSLARKCLTSEWYNKAVDKFLFWNMIGKHNFQCVWMAEDQSCPEGAKPQGIGCSVLCSTLNMKFQAIAIKRCLRRKKKHLLYIERTTAELKLVGIELKRQKLLKTYNTLKQRER